MKTILYLKHTILAVPVLFAASFVFAPAQAADLQSGKRAGRIRGNHRAGYGSRRG